MYLARDLGSLDLPYLLRAMLGNSSAIRLLQHVSRRQSRATRCYQLV
jgi:hypothetical protein